MEETELELKIPPAELVDVERLRVDGENPNRMSARQFKALKESVRRWGFIVPIITNRDYLVADGEHRLRAAKDLGLKQVSVVRLPVDDVHACMHVCNAPVWGNFRRFFNEETCTYEEPLHYSVSSFCSRIFYLNTCFLSVEFRIG